MADEKVRSGFDGRPLVLPTVELGPDSDEYIDTTQYATKDGRWAVEDDDDRFYLVGGDGKPRLDHPISKAQLA